MIRCRRTRERLHANITGMTILLVISGLLALTACVKCPRGTPGCPKLPFSFEARP